MYALTVVMTLSALPHTLTLQEQTRLNLIMADSFIFFLPPPMLKCHLPLPWLPSAVCWC